MNTKMQQAIQATRSGNTQEAQLLLTAILKEDPQDAQAWFLLSHLVDSESKQVAYLSKVLSLDPTHEKAKQRLARLKSAVSTPIPVTIPTQIPPAIVKTPPVVVEEAKTVIEPIKPFIPPPLPPVKAVEAEKPVPVIPATPPPKAMVPAAPPQPALSKKAAAAEAARKKQKRQYDMMMGFLGLVALIILIAIILVLTL